MIYFVRHGESEANAADVLAGSQIDSPITEHGRDQARLAADYLKNRHIHIDHIVSSPMQRTRETAEIIAKVIGIDLEDIEYDQRLIEHDCGSLTGHSTHISSVELVTAPGTESAEDLLSRAQSALRDIANLPGNVLIVSHAGIGRMIISKHRDLDIRHYNEVEGIDNGSVVALDLAGVID